MTCPYIWVLPIHKRYAGFLQIKKCRKPCWPPSTMHHLNVDCRCIESTIKQSGFWMYPVWFLIAETIFSKQLIALSYGNRDVGAARTRAEGGWRSGARKSVLVKYMQSHQSCDDVTLAFALTVAFCWFLLPRVLFLWAVSDCPVWVVFLRLSQFMFSTNVRHASRLEIKQKIRLNSRRDYCFNSCFNLL